MCNVIIESIDNYSHMEVNGRLLPEGLEMSEMHTYIGIFVYISVHVYVYCIICIHINIYV